MKRFVPSAWVGPALRGVIDVKDKVGFETSLKDIPSLTTRKRNDELIDTRNSKYSGRSNVTAYHTPSLTWAVGVKSRVPNSYPVGPTMRTLHTLTIVLLAMAT